MLGALLDLGVDKEIFKNELDKLRLDGFDIIVEKKVKNAITVTDIDVVLNHDLHSHSHEHDHPNCDKEHEHHGKQGHNHHQHHNHGHDHDHNHDHNCRSGREHNHEHHHSARNLNDIEKLIDASALNNTVKEFSKKVFREIARAEAKVHNKTIDEVHFHEVGAVDSIVDIVGVSICIDMLGVDKIYSSPLHDGKGFIQCQHGKLPVPVPAVMEILTESKIPYIIEDINTELVTPTGIGLIKCLSSRYGNMPPMTVDKVGYGAGKREIGRFNALRCILGTGIDEGGDDEISVLETNIDDMNPEVLGYVMEKLFDNGALDVFYTPVYMKKNRPGILMTVLSNREKEEVLAGIVLKETSTLGIRKSTSKRYILQREIRMVSTEYGPIRVKVSSAGDFKKSAPEYEDCKKVAKEREIPLWKVYEAVNKSIDGECLEKYINE